MGKNLSKYVFEIKLEQLTPYNKNFGKKEDRDEIVRTTEFKPRFDKYLVFKLKSEKKGYSKLLLPREDKSVEAFDYKVIVEKEEEKEKYSKTKELKVLLASRNSYYSRVNNVKFKMTFFSLKPDLIEIIKRVLPEFLAITNFGMRKNKGYGSFYISKEDENYVDIDKIEILKRFNYFKKAENRNYLVLNPSGKINGNIFEYNQAKEQLQVYFEGADGKRALIRYRFQGKNRNESIIIMKILKKDEEYRLYLIPNIELLSHVGINYKKHNIFNMVDVKEKEIEIVDLKKFDEVIKAMGVGENRWKK